MTDFSSPLLQLGIVVIVPFVIAYVVSRVLENADSKAGVPRAQFVAARKGVFALAGFLAVAGIVNVLGLRTQLALLTVGGIGALVFSLSVQDWVKSVIVGFRSFRNDSLRLGDRVEVAGSGKGVVVKVNLRNVWIRIEDKGALLIFDNAQIEAGRLLNYSAVERLEKRFDLKNATA